MRKKLLIGVGSEIGTRKLPFIIKEFKRFVITTSISFNPNDYFQTLHGLHVALRVSGETKTFKTQVDDSAVRKMRGLPYLTTEWVLTEEDWRGKSDSELSDRLVEGLSCAFQRLLCHADQLSELRDKLRAEGDFRKIICGWQARYLNGM